jgi:hypothetical protein
MQVKQPHRKTVKATLFYRLVQENATGSARIEEWGPGYGNEARRSRCGQSREFHLPYPMEVNTGAQNLVCRRMRKTRGLA